MTKFTQLLTAFLLATCASSVFAQNQEKPEKIVLEKKVGSVMASTGGDYESANIGKVLIRDESLMLTAGAKATVVYYYDNGKRKCTEDYTGPNTYVIDDSCVKAAYITGSAGNAGAQAGIIVGAALLTAAIIGNGGDNNIPVSASSR